MIHFVSKFEQPWRTEAYVLSELLKHYPEIIAWDWTKHRFPNRVSPGDVVLTSIPAVVPHNYWKVWKTQGAKLVAWIFDWIWGFGRREEAYLPNLKLFDLVFSTDGFDSSRWDERGIPRRYLPQAAPVESLLSPCDCRYDVSFVGSVYTPERQRLLEQLRQDFRVNHYNGKPRIWGEQLANCYLSGHVALGENFRNDIPGYWSSRVYLALATGCFLVTPRVEGLDRFYTNGKHLVAYDGNSYQDLAATLRHWIPLEDERRRIGLAGYKHTMEHHTYANRVRELVVVLQGAGIL